MTPKRLSKCQLVRIQEESSSTASSRERLIRAVQSLSETPFATNTAASKASTSSGGKRVLISREGADDGRAIRKSIFMRKGTSGLLEIRLLMKSGESEKQIRRFF